MITVLHSQISGGGFCGLCVCANVLFCSLEGTPGERFGVDLEPYIYIYIYIYIYSIQVEQKTNKVLKFLILNISAMCLPQGLFTN